MPIVVLVATWRLHFGQLINKAPENDLHSGSPAVDKPETSSSNARRIESVTDNIGTKTGTFSDIQPYKGTQKTQPED